MFLLPKSILLPDAPARNKTVLSSIKEQSSFSERDAFGGTVAQGLVWLLILQYLKSLQVGTPVQVRWKSLL